MTLHFKHFDPRLNKWIENDNPTENINKPILTEELNHTLLETYFPGKSFSFAHIDEHSQVADLYNHPDGHVLLLASGERLLYGESECLETIEKICPDPTHRGAYGSLFIGACDNSVYKKVNILVVDDSNGNNGGILPDDVAWRQVGDCHGKISPKLAQELSGSVDNLIQHRLTIPEDFRLAKGTLAPKNLDDLPYTNPDTKVDLIVPLSSFKGGDKENNPIEPGLYTKQVWLGEKDLSERGKIAISELHSSFPQGIKDVLRTLENQAKELKKIQKDPRKVAIRYCQKYEARKKYRSNTENDLDRTESEESEERDDDLMYRIIKADLESGHCQLLETQKVCDELKRFLRKEWLDIAIGKSIKFDRGMLIPSKDLSEGEIYVSWMNEDEEIICFRSPLLNSNGVCVLNNKFTEDALAPNGNALKGAIVISDDDHKRIQARIKALEEQGIDTDETDPFQTVLERMAADFDGDCLGVALARDFPNLTEEVKFKNLPENAYAPTKKEAKVSFRLPDGSYPPFEEVALFMARPPIGIIANHAKAIASLESEIEILQKIGTKSQKNDYVRRVAEHYQDLQALESEGEYQIPEEFQEKINEICEIASAENIADDRLDRGIKLNKEVYHEMMGKASYENQIGVDMPKSRRVPDMLTIADHKKLLYREPNFIRDKKDKNVYVDRGIEVHGFSPVELMVRQANTHFSESNLVARPTEQFRDLFPENYSAAQYNSALAKKAEFDKLWGDAVKHNTKFRNERGPVLLVTAASGKELEITNITKFKHPLAFKADTLDIRLDENRSEGAYHKIVAFAPDLNGAYSPLGTVCEISRVEQGLKAGMGTKQAQVKLATPLSERQVQLKFRIAYQMAEKWAESISPESKQALAEAAWHTCTTRQAKGASNKVGNFVFAAFGDEIVGQLEQLQFNKLTIGELKNSEVPIEQWRNKEIAIAIKEEEDRRYVYIKDPEGNSKKLGVLSNQQGQMPDCTSATGMVRADFIATGTLRVSGLAQPITFGKMNEHSFSDRHFIGDPVKVTLQTYQPPEKPILKLDGKEIGELDNKSQKMLREARKLREGTKLEVSLSTLGSGNSLHTLATTEYGNTIKVDRQNFSPHAGTRFSASKANVEIGFKQAKSAMGVWLDTGNGQPELAGIFTPNQKESKEVLMKNLLWRDGATFDAQITSNVSIAQLELKGDTVKYPPLGQWSKPREQVVTQPTAIEGQADTYLQKLKQLPSILHKLDQDWQMPSGNIETLPTIGLSVDEKVADLTAHWLKQQGIEHYQIPQSDLSVETETLRGYTVFRMRMRELSQQAKSVLAKHCGEILDANFTDVSTISPYYEKLEKMPLIEREEPDGSDYWQIAGVPSTSDRARKAVSQSEELDWGEAFDHMYDLIQQQERTAKVAPVVALLLYTKLQTEPESIAIDPQTQLHTLVGRENIVSFDPHKKELFLIDKASNQIKMAAIPEYNENGSVKVWNSLPLPDSSPGLSEKDVETFGSAFQVEIKKKLLQSPEAERIRAQIREEEDKKQKRAENNGFSRE